MANEYNNIDYWFETATYDLDTARVMLDGRRYLYVGFMCHQVIEKALKGIYVAEQRKVPPYSHGLAFMSEKTSIHSQLSEEQKDFIDSLEPLNVEARYPAYRDGIAKTLTHERCQEMLKSTEELFQWIKMKR